MQDYILYTKDNCKFCVMAKKLLSSEGKNYSEFNITNTSNRETMFEHIKKSGAPAPKTVPQIFHNDKYIGGYTELSKLIHG